MPKEVVTTRSVSAADKNAWQKFLDWLKGWF